jgi:hypothetical protein
VNLTQDRHSGPCFFDQVCKTGGWAGRFTPRSTGRLSLRFDDAFFLDDTHGPNGHLSGTAQHLAQLGACHTDQSAIRVGQP